MAGSESVYAEVSAAFIAGFAGLSYIRERQQKDLGLDRQLNPSDVAEASLQGEQHRDEDAVKQPENMK